MQNKDQLVKFMLAVDYAYGKAILSNCYQIKLWLSGNSLVVLLLLLQYQIRIESEKQLLPNMK